MVAVFMTDRDNIRVFRYRRMFNIAAGVYFVRVHDNFQTIVASDQKTCYAQPFDFHRDPHYSG
jgi:hypothetical protein